MPVSGVTPNTPLLLVAPLMMRLSVPVFVTDIVSTREVPILTLPKSIDCTLELNCGEIPVPVTKIVSRGFAASSVKIISPACKPSTIGENVM